MATATVNVRMEQELKRQFEAFCKDVGMSMTTAINIFAKRTVRDNRIPFAIESDIPNAATLRAFEEIQQMKADPSIGKSYTNVKQMIAEALAEEDEKNV